MNEDYAKVPMVAGAQRPNLIGKEGLIDHSPTLAENIDRRIQRMEEEIARLKKVKFTLETGSILDVKLDDLRQAMNY